MTGAVITRLAFGTVFGGIGKRLSAGWDWITASATHLLLAALLAAGGWGWLEHHEAAKWRRVADSTEARGLADNRIWADADRINHKSIQDLITALDGQSRMVRQWGDVAHVKQQAASAALRQATARGARAEVHAQQIEAEGAQRSPGGPGCVSGPAVMSSKGEL